MSLLKLDIHILITVRPGSFYEGIRSLVPEWCLGVPLKLDFRTASLRNQLPQPLSRPPAFSHRNHAPGISQSNLHCPGKRYPLRGSKSDFSCRKGRPAMESKEIGCYYA